MFLHLPQFIYEHTVYTSTIRNQTLYLYLLNTISICSKPNSATSSPRFCLRKNSKFESLASPRQANKSVPPLANNQIWRSKSCGDRRACAPLDEIDDLWLYGAIALRYNKQNTNTGVNNGGVHCRKSGEEMDRYDVNFKCNALCLFLPGFIKAKYARPRKEQMVRKNNTNVNVISRAVSLEKFECGSWASSTIIPDHDVDDGDSMNLYFDLPLEMINNLGNDYSFTSFSCFRVR